LFFNKIQKKIQKATNESLKKEILKNINRNIKYLSKKKFFSVQDIRNVRFGKKTNIGLIVGGGPSLRKNNFIPLIKKYKKNFVIISTDGSLYYLLENKIIPDLVITLDPHKNRIVRWFGDSKLKINSKPKDDYFRRQDIDVKFRDEINTNNKIIKILNKNGNKLNIAACTSSSSKVVERLKNIKAKIFWWHPFLDEPNKKNSITKKIYKKLKIPIINSFGNVGSAAWIFAESVLGLKKIVLLGIDCSYYIDTPLNQTQYYDVIKKSFGIKNLKKFYKKIYNPKLKRYFYTDYIYYWYKKIFLDIVKLSKSKTYNCSNGGILYEKPLKIMKFNKFIEKNI